MKYGFRIREIPESGDGRLPNSLSHALKGSIGWLYSYSRRSEMAAHRRVYYGTVGHGIIRRMGGADGQFGFLAVSPKVPEGFFYRQDFISETEEQDLMREIRKTDLVPFKYYQFTGKRRTTSFGWQYEFGANEITTAPDIPPFLLPFRTRAGAAFDLDPDSLVQSSIIEYSVGSPIGWHRDIPQFGVVVGISLGAACRMRFRKYSRTRSKSIAREEISSMELQPRSAYLMSGASRESWQHSIPPVKELRYSIMMRTLRAKP